MLTLDRDRQIVLSVDRFGQLATAHIATLHFEGLTAKPMQRALTRLVERKYLARIERRLVGGTGAGSGQYVYQLGPEGWRAVGRPGRYWPYRAVNYHTLAIADAYMEALAYERENRISILGFETEPDSWRSVSGIEVRPDLYLEIRKGWEDVVHRYWFEIDMGTERRTKILAKMVEYYNADGTLPAGENIPMVIFLAPDDRRAREIRWWIESGTEEQQQLFNVFTVPEYARLLFS